LQIRVDTLKTVHNFQSNSGDIGLEFMREFMVIVGSNGNRRGIHVVWLRMDSWTADCRHRGMTRRDAVLGRVI